MKKFYITTLITLLTLLLILPSSSFAHTSGHEYHDHELEGTEVSNAENDGDFEIKYIACPGGGKHTMMEHGKGDLYQNGKQLINSGIVHQCSKCYIVFLSQYDPEEIGMLGKYGTEQLSYRLTTSRTIREPNYVGTNSSTSPTIAPWDSYIWY